MKEGKATKEDRVSKHWLNKRLFLFFLVCFIGITAGFFVWKKVSLVTIDKFSAGSVIVGEGGEQKKITVKQLNKGLAAARKFYESQDLSSKGMRVDFSTQEGEFRLKIKEKEVLNKLVENAMIEILAERNEINIAESDLTAEFEKRAKEVGSKEIFSREIKSLYGWSTDDFEQNVLRNQLQVKGLFEKYAEELKRKQSYGKIQEVSKKIKEKSSDFDLLAKQFSEGESADSGGHLGWFKKEQIIEEVADKVFSMKEGEISDVILSPLGYHIIRVDGIRGENKTVENNDNIEENNSGKEDLRKEKIGEVNNEKEVEISQIFIREDNFVQWLVNQKKSIPVKVLAKDYLWDSENVKIDFKDNAMREKEAEIRIKSEGDPSI